MRETQRRRVVGGSLIVVGLALYLLQRLQGIGEGAILLLIGVAFLTAYLYRKAYGFLVPAGVLLGLGLGSAVEDSLRRFGDASVLGLGLGFVAIYVIALIYERRSHWWPLIPGAALILAALPNTEGVLKALFDHWPLILVFIGLVVLLGAGRRARPGAGSPGD